MQTAIAINEVLRKIKAGTNKADANLREEDNLIISTIQHCGLVTPRLKILWRKAGFADKPKAYEVADVTYSTRQEESQYRYVPVRIDPISGQLIMKKVKG